MSIVTQAIGALTGPIFDVIDKSIEDKDEANRLKQEIRSQVIEAKDSMAQYQMKVILAEATGESWMQRNWRPSLMFALIAILINNYLLTPAFSGWFGVDIEVWEFPDQFWTLLNIGVGGYIGGRSVEKLRSASQTRPKKSGPGLYQRVKAAVKNE